MVGSDTGSRSAEYEQQFSLRDYADVLRRRRWVVVFAFGLALGTAVGLSLAMPPIYRAVTTAVVDKTPPILLLDQRGKASPFADQTAGQAPDVFTLVELTGSATVRKSAETMLADALGAEVARAALRGLAAQPVKGTELVRISVEHADPRVAAAAANAVAQSLIDMNQTARRQRATETREFIGRELAQARSRLREAEDRLIAFRNTHGEVSLAQETSLNLQKLADLQAQLVDVRLQQNAVRTQIAKARERLAVQAKISPTEWAPSPLIGVLQAQLAKLEIELSGLRREFTPRHPAIITAQARIEETRARLSTELAKNLSPGAYGVDPVYGRLALDVAQAEVTLAMLNSRERELGVVINGYAGRVRNVPTREAETARLTRDTREAEQIYLLLSEKHQDARIAETSIGSSIRVVDPAKVPNSPVKPRRQMNTLFGALFGLFVGVLGAFVIELLDDTVRSSEDVERALGAPVLGAIPIINGVGAPGSREDSMLSLATNGDSYSPTAEAFRTLRTHVLFSMPDIQHKRLLVTSALPQEGKTTIAANLAVAIASTDRKVWLVDGDLRRSALRRLFPEAGSQGLSCLLAGQAEPDEVVRPAYAANLWYVDSGQTVPNPAELLGAQRMARLMEQARSRADVVLLDSPPLLPVTDAEVTSTQADGVLLVVKFGETDRRALAHVRRRLDRVGARVVGAVLNFVPASDRDSRYYGLYYHPHPRLGGELSASHGNGEAAAKTAPPRKGKAG
jgi:tyrosine-protein kinase Etk/Wzc